MMIKNKRMMPYSTYPMVIIGDGYAAAVLLIHLAKRKVDLSSIAVIGKSKLGRGAAYGTEHPHFRLNVRDDLMIIDQDIPDDFVNWGKQLDDPSATSPNNAGQFYRRRDFARYLGEAMQKHNIENQITHIHARAIDLSSDNISKNNLRDEKFNQSSWHITLDNDQFISARKVILATGNPPPSHHNLIANDIKAELIDKSIIDTPWKGNAVDRIPSKAHIGIIGGGLTALDACLALYENGHKGQISLITPHGLLPPEQSAWEAIEIPPFPNPITASGFLRHIRRYLPDDEWTSYTWQSAWEGIREQLSDGWQCLSQEDRRRLLHRLGWLWSLIRYRACPQSIMAITLMQAAGQMQIIPDRVKMIKKSVSSQSLSLALNIHKDLNCDHVIIASGIGHDPLLTRLQKQQIAGAMINGAISVNHDLHLLDPDNKPQPNLWVLGPPTYSALGDIVGATSTAKQAARLADKIAALY